MAVRINFRIRWVHGVSRNQYLVVIINEDIPVSHCNRYKLLAGEHGGKRTVADNKSRTRRKKLFVLLVMRWLTMSTTMPRSLRLLVFSSGPPLAASQSRKSGTGRARWSFRNCAGRDIFQVSTLARGLQKAAMEATSHRYLGRPSVCIPGPQ